MSIESNDVSLTISNENYLDVIHELSHATGPVRSVDVAGKLGVSKVSVNKALRVLKQAGLVEQQPYGSIALTEKGVVHAHRVTHRHETLFRFLHNLLGLDSQTADSEACQIEHVISDDTVRELDAFLKKQGIAPNPRLPEEESL